MKICSKCKKEKQLSEYHKRSNRPCGVRSQCKECYKKYPKHKKSRIGYMRQYDLKKSYNITIEQYNNILNKQNGKCAICEIESEKLKGKKKFLCVDHNHTTNKIRGLLCDKCNRGIGLLLDSEYILLKAINYLKHNN